ncbi:hypothetical protein GCM10027187_49170 [Streptosporangium sandarakinum]
MLCGAPVSSSRGKREVRTKTELPLRMSPRRSVVEKKSSSEPMTCSVPSGMVNVVRLIAHLSVRLPRRTPGGSAVFETFEMLPTVVEALFPGRSVTARDMS